MILIRIAFVVAMVSTYILIVTFWWYSLISQHLDLQSYNTEIQDAIRTNVYFSNGRNYTYPFAENLDSVIPLYVSKNQYYAVYDHPIAYNPDVNLNLLRYNITLYTRLDTVPGILYNGQNIYNAVRTTQDDFVVKVSLSVLLQIVIMIFFGGVGSLIYTRMLT